jgi:hypothetical protein
MNHGLHDERSQSIKVKRTARAKLRKAVSLGHMNRPSMCSLCNEPGWRIEAHHPDYSKPLEVIWCCGVCHKRTFHSKSGHGAVKKTGQIRQSIQIAPDLWEILWQRRANGKEHRPINQQVDSILRKNLLPTSKGWYEDKPSTGLVGNVGEEPAILYCTPDESCGKISLTKAEGTAIQEGNNMKI